MSTEKIQVAVVSYGSVGYHAVQAIRATKDMQLAGVVRRKQTSASSPVELAGVPIVEEVSALNKVDVAILCGPSRRIPEIAPQYLKQGIHTVDSFDIHGEPLLALRNSLDSVGKQYGRAAVISSGWDPGTDSVIRTLFLAMAPKGVTYTNFGPGMSMGHSVCAKSKPGVRDALSITIPTGTGVHRRMVYVELEPDASVKEVEKAIQTDDYFRNDDTRVTVVESVEALRNVSHGVHLQRNGVSGSTHNQSFEFRMSINNPALTSQIMVSCARAAARRLSPGAYTLPEIAPLDLLPGDREEWIKQLV